MRAVATIALLTAALLGPLAAPAAAATLTASPDRAVVPATITVSGSCDPIRAGTTVFPRATTLTLDGAPQATPMTVAKDGTFSGTAPLPADLGVGDHALASTCGGEATITVLAAPTLVLSPASVRAPARVSASGTCLAGSSARAELFLAGRGVGTTAVDPRAGTFGPVTFPVPDGLPAGRHQVTSSCGGSAVLALLAAPVTSPATTAAPPTAAPTAGPAPPPASGSSPVVAVVVVAVAVLLLLALLTALLRYRRLRRQRRWLDDRVRVDASTAAWHPSGTAPADGPGVEVDLIVRREPPVLRMEEVGSPD